MKVYILHNILAMNQKQLYHMVYYTKLQTIIIYYIIVVQNRAHQGHL